VGQRNDQGVTSERRFVLASASPARLRLLRAAGFDPEVVVSGVHEDGVDHLQPAAAALALAERKAAAVARHQSNALVLGCDSLLELDGAALGKPASAAEATARWQLMRGRTGVLHTGHCVIDTSADRSAADVASTVVHFAVPTDDEVAAYVASDEPLAVAGAFTIDGRGGVFVDAVDGDPGTVIGVSLPLLRRLLAELDVPVTSLWV
jgi:septum formation protein